MPFYYLFIYRYIDSEEIGGGRIRGIQKRIWITIKYIYIYIITAGLSL